MRSLWISAATLAMIVGAMGPAHAEVASAEPGAVLITAEATVSSEPATTWRALTRIERWWGSSHTYSGEARRLRLDARAGGCWCERWDNGQSVEHARVVLVMEREGVRTLRAIGGLGPLQEMGAVGVLTFTIRPDPQGSKVEMTYRVSGDSGLGLDQVAPLVDQVMVEQFARLARYADTGSPE